MGEHSIGWKPLRFASWFPTLISCSPNLPSVYIRLCEHGNHLHFFYKITNERGTKTVFTYARVKWFYGQSERAYYLNYFIICFDSFELLSCLIAGLSSRELKLADEGKTATPTKSGSDYGLKKKSFEKWKSNKIVYKLIMQNIRVKKKDLKHVD